MSATEAHDPAPARAWEARRWLLHDALQDYGDLLASLGTSLREAAFRGSDAAILIHIKQARLVLIEAISAAKELDQISPESPR